MPAQARRGSGAAICEAIRVYHNTGSMTLWFANARCDLQNHLALALHGSIADILNAEGGHRDEALSRRFVSGPHIDRGIMALLTEE